MAAIYDLKLVKMVLKLSTISLMRKITYKIFNMHMFIMFNAVCNVFTMLQHFNSCKSGIEAFF